MTIVAHTSGVGSIPLRRAPEACCEQHCRERDVPPQPVVRVQLVQRVDGFPLSLVRCVRYRPFEHRNKGERRSGKKRPTERDRAVTALHGVALRPRDVEAFAGAAESVSAASNDGAGLRASR
jgi:hypothetical protein